jgi:hypothetical protein
MHFSVTVASLAGCLFLTAYAAQFNRTALAGAGISVKLASATASSPDGRSLSVTVAVANYTLAVSPAKVWWTLGRQGSGSAWRNADYTSEQRTIAVPAGGHATVRWDETPGVTDGAYAVTAWLHIRDSTGRFVHADVKAAGTITWRRGHDPDLLLRHQAPIGGVAFEALTASTDPQDFPAILHVSGQIRNASLHPTMMDVSWDLTEGRPSGLSGWSGEPLVFSGDATPIGLPANEVTELRIVQMIPLPPGKYSLRVLLTDGLETYDRVALPDPVVVGMPAAGKRELPAGSLMVERIEAPTSWSEGQRATVNLWLRNLSGQPQQGEVGWILGAPGDSRPWQDPIAAADPHRISLAPWGEQQVVLASAALVVPPGKYELTGWVHGLDATGASVHSDAVRSGQSITVAGWDPSVSRRALPAGSLMVERIEAPISWSEGQRVTVDLWLRNLTGQVQQGEVGWILGTPGDSRPWQDPIATGAPHRVTLAPWGGQRVRLASGALVVPPGQYKLTGWVHAQDGKGAFVHSDAVASIQSITLSSWDPSISRRELPAGSLMVEVRGSHCLERGPTGHGRLVAAEPDGPSAARGGGLDLGHPGRQEAMAGSDRDGCPADGQLGPLGGTTGDARKLFTGRATRRL